jgi:NAD(P)H-hydrate epimerase
MEIAGAGCFLLIRELLRARRCVVAAGPGQNGGDGFVIARYAIAAGSEVEVFAMKQPAAGGPAATQLSRLSAFQPRISFGNLTALEGVLAAHECVLVDALFGTGLSFPLRPEASRWIEAVGRARGTIVSIDLPSGLDGDTGEAPSGCVLPALTLTIGALKRGLVTQEGARRAGRVEVVPLPYPPRLIAALARG